MTSSSGKLIEELHPDSYAFFPAGDQNRQANLHIPQRDVQHVMHLAKQTIVQRCCVQVCMLVLTRERVNICRLMSSEGAGMVVFERVWVKQVRI